jgi:peptidoglycan/LPS O-acetylase OafA/YrhL
MAHEFWRLANGILFVLFLASVAFQYNDPDPLIWMAIYGMAAALCVLAIRGRSPRLLAAATAAVALAWAATLAIRVIGKQSLLDSEEGREMLGLVIVGVWTGLLAAVGSPRQKTGEGSGAS